MGLASLLLGKANPISQFVDSRQNTLGAWGAGLASGPSFQQGLSNAVQYGAQAAPLDQQAAEQRRAEEDAKASMNRTAEYLRSVPGGAPFADAIEKGGVDASTAFKGWFEFSQPKPPGEAQNPYMNLGDGNLFNWQTGERLTNPNAQPKMPDAPKGFMWGPDGKSMQRIPGGPEDPSINAPAAAVNLQRLNSQTDNVVAAIDKATGQVAWDSTGVFGQVLGAVGGTKAMDLRETAKTIKANLGFSELQAMRDASPTGGALGQVAVQELDALQATLASINPDQSEGQLRENLAKVKTLLERQKMFREQANQAKFAAPAGGGQWTVLGVE